MRYPIFGYWSQAQAFEAPTTVVGAEKKGSRKCSGSHTAVNLGRFSGRKKFLVDAISSVGYAKI